MERRTDSSEYDWEIVRKVGSRKRNFSLLFIRNLDTGQNCMAFGKYFKSKDKLVNLEVDTEHGNIEVWTADHDQIAEELDAIQCNVPWAEHLCWTCEEFSVLADESACEPSGWEGIMPPDFYGTVTKISTLSNWYAKYVGVRPQPADYDVVEPFTPRRRSKNKR